MWLSPDLINISRNNLLSKSGALLKQLKLSRNRKEILDLFGLTEQNQFEKSADATNSLWRLTYDEQLRHKESCMVKQLQFLARELQKYSILPIIDPNTGYLENVERIPIVPSPVTAEYRSKNSYTVGVGVDGNVKTVGYPYGISAHVFSIPLSPMIIVNKKQHNVAAKLFQEFLRKDESAAVGTSFFKEAGYKVLCVRSDRYSSHLMLMVSFRNMRTKTSELEYAKQAVSEFFLQQSFPELHPAKINSLYFQTWTHLFSHSDASPFEHLGGDTHLYETVLGRRFRISPGSFFQINVDCAERLFTTVAEHCHMDKDTVLLDLCCGGGVYSIVLADKVKRAIGVDVSAANIADAEFNARLNNVDNVQFVTGHLNELQPVLDGCRGEKCVAVVNPGRWGLQSPAISIIRQFPELRTLIYVSCYIYSTAFKNIVDLMRPPNEAYAGVPFKLVKAVPVDMFPQTFHYETILLFER